MNKLGSIDLKKKKKKLWTKVKKKLKTSLQIPTRLPK